MKIKITRDLFDIADRIKELNPNYEIWFDTDRQKYVLTAFGGHQAVIPYDELDVRTLDYAYETRAENAEKILAEIDSYNLRRQRESAAEVRDEIENEFSRRLRLARQ